ncbi:MAG: Lrp/AsnC family transcriptional regulator [Candidatus Hodarchaeota archaeon]
MTEMIDAIDSKIINLLQKDGRIPSTKIARGLGISEATVRNRIQRLIQEGIIQIVAVGNPFKLGFGIVGTIKINIDIKKVDNVMNELMKIDELWYLALATGGTDIDTEFNAKSLDDLHGLIFERINKIDGVIRTETSLIMRYVKRRYDWGTAIDEERRAEMSSQRTTKTRIASDGKHGRRH